MYYVKPDRSEVYFVTSQPEPEFGLESWSAEGDVDVVHLRYGERGPGAAAVLCAELHPARPAVRLRHRVRDLRGRGPAGQV
jgi:salicylate hydroxylase/6-hydroxynicotinate 3-monooxygenase